MKYLAAFLLPTTVVIAFNAHGFWTFFPLVFAFGIIPIAEFALGTDSYNLSDTEKELAAKNPLYDTIIYGTVVFHLGAMFYYLKMMSHADDLAMIDIIGRTISIGLMCGVYGINVAHELGHRTNKLDQWISRILLTTSLYLHFYIEHNRGHHRNVGTPEDAATARKGESVYAFWRRTIPGSWINAWRIVEKERQRKKLKVYTLTNEMLAYQIIQVSLVVLVFLIFGWKAGIGFIASALLGMILLETVNYIEHYGLTRKKLNEFRYEDVTPIHSWNSDYILGRLVLFELTRHSDHHTTPSKEYQLLDSPEGASALPAGYPAMMLLCLWPTVWFKVMDKRIPT